MPVAVFYCAACGKRYAWKAASAGKTRVCECGEFVPVPATAPTTMANAASFAGMTSFGTAAGQTVVERAAVAGTDTLAGNGEGQLEEPPPVIDEAELLARKVREAEEAMTYALTPMGRAPQARPRTDTGVKKSAGAKPEAPDGEPLGQAFLADSELRIRRQKFASGPMMRELIIPGVLFLLASAYVGYEVQRRLAGPEVPASFIGHGTAFYLMVNAVGLAAGCLLVWGLLRVEFGKFLPSLIKYLAIIAIAPAVWAAVVELFFTFKFGGINWNVYGATVGWLIEGGLVYALFANLFDLESIDTFWTVSAVNGIKIFIFVAWYVLFARK